MSNDNGMQNIFKEWFEYYDGALYWKKYPGYGDTRAGDRAGSDSSGGYRQIKLFGKQYMEHRVIWIIHHGDIPDGMQIDHSITRIANYNFIENLACVTQTQNINNSERITNAFSKYSGVDKHRNVWQAHVWSEGRMISLGHYDEELDAARAVNIYCRDNGIPKFNDIIRPFDTPLRRVKANAKKKSAQKGVLWHDQTQKWRVQFWIESRNKSFGAFDTEEDAITMALAVIMKYNLRGK